jgi:hypothetical protein
MSGDGGIIDRTAGGGLRYKPKAGEWVTIAQPDPPLLRLGRDHATGKIHAEYDPANLTEAALALMAEITRLQAGQRAGHWFD